MPVVLFQHFLSTTLHGWSLIYHRWKTIVIYSIPETYYVREKSRKKVRYSLLSPSLHSIVEPRGYIKAIGNTVNRPLSSQDRCLRRWSIVRSPSASRVPGSAGFTVGTLVYRRWTGGVPVSAWSKVTRCADGPLRPAIDGHRRSSRPRVHVCRRHRHRRRWESGYDRLLLTDRRTRPTVTISRTCVARRREVVPARRPLAVRGVSPSA